MNRPTWVTVVGILGILLGAFGLLGAIQAMMMPQMMKMQKEMFANIQKSTEMAQQQQRAAMAQRQGQVPIPPLAMPDMSKMMDKLMTFPSWYETWSIASGIVSAVVSGVYLFASISLLSVKKNAPVYFYGAVVASILWTLVRSGVAIKASIFMAMAMIGGSLAGLVINLVLLIVVLTSDKQIFRSADMQSQSV